MFTHLLVPTDGSPIGTKAILEGIGLAKVLGAKITILTVIRPFRTFSLNPELVTETPTEHRQHENEHFREDIRLAKQAASSAGVQCEHVTAECDHLSDAVIEAANHHRCDLVVMPAHERVGLLKSSHIDTETVRLLARSELPVLVLHEGS
jgi:nucleotide-binding universal stress UspA family protein